MPRVWLSLATVVFLLGSTTAPAADAWTTMERVEELVDRLAVAVREVDVDGTREMKEELARVGPDAVSILVQQISKEGQLRLEEPGLDEFLRRMLIHVIGNIPGERSVEALLDLTLNHPEPSLAVAAGASMPQEAVLRREFSEAECEELIGRIRNGGAGPASHWAALMARAEHVEDERLTGAIIEGFARAIKKVADKADASSYSRVLNREVVIMSRFLKAFRHLNDATVVPRLRQGFQGVESEAGRKWWTMALGTSGDRTVAGDLRVLIDSTGEHATVRGEALRAYAHALGKDALPLLQKYEQDETSSWRRPDGLTPLEAVARVMQAEMEERK